jgi:hypothetical protein
MTNWTNFTAKSGESTFTTGLAERRTIRSLDGTGSGFVSVPELETVNIHRDQAHVIIESLRG